MKWYILLLISVLCGFPVLVQAQNDTSEDEEKNSSKQYLPERGDTGIGFDATPFLNYLGNMFNETADNSLDLGDNTLYFRRYLTNSSALRVVASFSLSKDVNDFFVDDDAADLSDPLSNNQLNDRMIYQDDAFYLNVGYQKFHGEGRLRGFYGVDAGFGIANEKTEYEYGNEMTAVNTAPTTHWGSQSERILEDKNGRELSLGIGANCGVEYYLMPRFAIGAEVGLFYRQIFEGESTRKTEEIVDGVHREYDQEIDAGGRRRELKTSFPHKEYGSLYIMAHF